MNPARPKRRLTLLPRSFRLRIALGTVVSSGIVLLGFFALFLSATQRIGMERIDRELHALGDPQVRRIHPAGHWRHFDESLKSVHSGRPKGLYVINICVRNGAPLYNSPDWPIGITGKTLGLPVYPPPGTLAPVAQFHPPRFSIPGPPEDTVPPDHLIPPRYMTVTETNRTWRLTVMGNDDVFFAIALDLSDFSTEIRKVQTLFTIAIPAALLLLAIAGWWIAGQALRPIRTLTDVAGRITIKGLDQRVPPADAPEFRGLIDVMNGMLDRLDKSFRQATRFSADAAHELKTPLTILQGQLELAVQNATSETEQQTYAGLLEEVQRLKNIVRKLLLLSQADAGRLRLHRQRLDLSEEIESLYNDATVLAPELEVTKKSIPGLFVKGDPDLLRQVFQNLLSNAIKYNRTGGSISMALLADGPLARVTVTNTTTSTTPIDQTRIFTRFYRGDKSRGRNIEGVGLGLSLAREIALVHQGDLVLDHTPAGTVSFTLTLPRDVTD